MIFMMSETDSDSDFVLKFDVISSKLCGLRNLRAKIYKEKAKHFLKFVYLYCPMRNKII